MDKMMYEQIDTRTKKPVRIRHQRIAQATRRIERRGAVSDAPQSEIARAGVPYWQC